MNCVLGGIRRCKTGHRLLLSVAWGAVVTSSRWLVRCASSAAIFVIVSLSHLFAQCGSGQAKSLISDPPSAMSSSPEKAWQGQLQQELKLAGDYYAGRGVATDLKQSAYWYKKAADQGDPGAQVELGYFYLHGIGVAQDQTQAVRWFARAAASGSHLAKLNLATAYLKGTGVKQDTALATKMLQDLVKQHDARAEGYLGVMYTMGVGVDKNIQAAEKLFRDGANQKDPGAEYSLGVLYSAIDDHPKDLEKAAGYFRRSAAQGYIASMHSLGLLLVKYPSLSQQPGEALDMLTEAANVGSWRSSLTLGILFRDGRYTSANLSEAYRWFLIGAQQGGLEAENLARNDLAFTGGKLDRVERDGGPKRALPIGSSSILNAICIKLLPDWRPPTIRWTR